MAKATKKVVNICTPSEVNLGIIKTELPKGGKTLTYLCMKCNEYIRRDNVAVGDDVFDVNLVIACKCGRTVLISVANTQKEKAR